MKRPASSDSLGALMAACPTADEHSPQSNRVYSRDFQSMLDGLDEDGCMEDSGQMPEKKRRLRADQVKALEKNFEVENKLEPDRKLKLAQELGLQPRQVAVWFQNRRARWKTKQLERDYGVLKASFDSLKDSFDSLQNHNETLLKEIEELKSKLNDDNTESNLSIKTEQMLASEFTDAGAEPPAAAASLAGSFGPSDSDSSAILNDAATGDASPSGGFTGAHQLLISSTSSPSSAASPPSISYLQLSEPAAGDALGHTQLVKMEEHNFFDEEACNFFSEEQAPSLHWYCPEQWT